MPETELVFDKLSSLIEKSRLKFNYVQFNFQNKKLVTKTIDYLTYTPSYKFKIISFNFNTQQVLSDIKNDFIINIDTKLTDLQVEELLIKIRATIDVKNNLFFILFYNFSDLEFAQTIKKENIFSLTQEEAQTFIDRNIELYKILNSAIYHYSLIFNIDWQSIINFSSLEECSLIKTLLDGNICKNTLTSEQNKLILKMQNSQILTKDEPYQFLCEKIKNQINSFFISQTKYHLFFYSNKLDKYTTILVHESRFIDEIVQRKWLRYLQFSLLASLNSMGKKCLTEADIVHAFGRLFENLKMVVDYEVPSLNMQKIDLLVSYKKNFGMIVKMKRKNDSNKELITGFQQSNFSSYSENLKPYKNQVILTMFVKNQDKKDRVVMSTAQFIVSEKSNESYCNLVYCGSQGHHERSSYKASLIEFSKKSPEKSLDNIDHISE